MCVIVSKSKNASFPTKETLEICWNNNPDGAGFMYTADNKVHIRKGFMNFESFWKSLQNVRTKYGDKIACVMHFRIGTQGGNIPENTHPFPLSSNMNDLRKLKSACDIGVAHNGIIELTSTYSKKVNYSDTMKFITDYLSLIIHDEKWYKSKDTCTLIERLIESRLCVLDKSSHIQLLGQGWNEDKKTGVWYSNESWKSPKQFKFKSAFIDEWDLYKDKHTNTYDFDETYCPGVLDGDDSYCEACANKYKCSFYHNYINSIWNDTNDKWGY